MDLPDAVTAIGQQLVTTLGRVGDELQGIREALASQITPADTSRAQVSTVQIPTIIAVTAESYGVSQPDLRDPAGNQKAEQAQAMAMYLCRQLTDLSLVTIGQAFGRRHMTVMRAEQKLRVAVDQGQPTATKVHTLVERIVGAQRATSTARDEYERSARSGGAGAASSADEPN